MARTFNPDFSELLSEAFSRIEILPREIAQEHIEEAIRSANFVLTEFANRGVHQYQLVEQSITVVNGTATYDLMDGALDVWHAVYRKDGSDTPLWPFARSVYHAIPDKTAEGRPNQYFCDRGKIGNTRRTITLWPVPDNSIDTLQLWVWARADAQTALSEQTPVAAEFTDAYADGLALRMAKKFNRLKVSDLKKDFYGDPALGLKGSLEIATTASRERAPTRLRMRGYSRGRRP